MPRWRAPSRPPARAALGQQGLEAGLGGQQDAGEQDQKRREELERGRRCLDQEHRTAQPPERRRRRERGDPAPLSLQLRPVGDRPGEVARQDGDGVGDICEDRRVPNRQERRKPHERATAGDRVDHTRGHTRRDQERALRGRQVMAEAVKGGEGWQASAL